MRRITGTLAAGAFGLVLLAGCGGSDTSDEIAERIVEESSGDKVEIDSENGEFTVEGEDGSVSFGSGTELPDDFPEGEVPLPDDAELQGFIAGGSEGTEGWTLTFTVDDATDAASTYEGQLTDDGYTVENNFSGDSGAGSFRSFSARNGTWMVTVIAGSDGKDSTLNVSVQPDDSQG